MAKRVLLLAYMFPPIVDGGAFRPASFARYLPEFGYETTVLTRPDSGKLPLNPESLSSLPSSVEVHRVPLGFVEGWNDRFKRRLRFLASIESAVGKAPGWFAEAVAWRAARRDHHLQWEGAWMEPAIEEGLKLIEQYRPAAIIATGPPFESLKAGWHLHQRTRIPWIADFRDPWTYGVLWNPSNPKRARVEQEWEERVVRSAGKILVVTPSMARTMRETHPEAAGKVELLMNGFEDMVDPAVSPPADRLVMSYIGSVTHRRLPAVFFEAVRRLRTNHPEIIRDLRVQLIGPNYDDTSPNERINAEGVADIVEWLGPVSQNRSRELMRQSHVLLHIECVATYAVSGKLFEYLAAKRPVVGMTPSGSDDEWFLNQSGAGSNAGLADADAVAEVIRSYWEQWRRRALSVNVDDVWLKQFHRREQTKKLATLLDALTT